MTSVFTGPIREEAAARASSAKTFTSPTFALRVFAFAFASPSKGRLLRLVLTPGHRRRLGFLLHDGRDLGSRFSLSLGRSVHLGQQRIDSSVTMPEQGSGLLVTRAEACPGLGA